MRIIPIALTTAVKSQKAEVKKIWGFASELVPVVKPSASESTY
jgi:hypothetical protein